MARTFADTTNDRLTLASSSITDAPLTISCWVKLTAASASGRVIVDIKNSATAASGRDSFMLAMNSTETFFARTGSSASASVSGSTAVISTGVWYHLAATFASATSRYAWLDGTATTQNTTSRTPAGIDQITIGCEQYASGATFISPWYGEIAEVAIWNAALEDSPGATPGVSSEIASLAKGVSPLLVRPQSLVYYWPIVGKYSPEIDFISAGGMTVTGTAPAEHPRVFLPKRRQARRFTTAVAGGFQAAWARNANVIMGTGAR